MADAPPPTVSELVEALCLFHEPWLNSRYHGVLLRRGYGSREDLMRLPWVVLEAERLARQGAEAWQSEIRSGPSPEFVSWVEYTVLESFLTLVESQLAVLNHVAREAPTQRARAAFDSMIDKHRDVARALRGALRRQADLREPPMAQARLVQEEPKEGDFRGHLEKAIQDAEKGPHGVRAIVLSATGFRHLRDQGCFKEGAASLAGHRVMIDFGWSAPAFAIETRDRVPLEEIMQR